MTKVARTCKGDKVKGGAGARKFLPTGENSIKKKGGGSPFWNKRKNLKASVCLHSLPTNETRKNNAKRGKNARAHITETTAKSIKEGGGWLQAITRIRNKTWGLAFRRRADTSG